MLANIQLARMELKESDRGYGRRNRADDSLGRDRELSEQLLTYSRGATLQGKTTDMVSLIRYVGTLYVRGTRVNCEFVILSVLWGVPRDEDLVRLMLNDLFLSLDSSLPIGTIHVSARNILVRTAEVRVARPGDYVSILRKVPKQIHPQEELNNFFRTGSTLAVAQDLSVAESQIRKSGGVLVVRSGRKAVTEIFLHLMAQHAPAVAKPV